MGARGRGETGETGASPPFHRTGARRDGRADLQPCVPASSGLVSPAVWAGPYAGDKRKMSRLRGCCVFLFGEEVHLAGEEGAHGVPGLGSRVRQHLERVLKREGQREQQQFFMHACDCGTVLRLTLAYGARLNPKP